MKFPHKSSQFLEQNISFKSWQQKVNHVKRLLQREPKVTWLLFEPDCFEFSILFFALIAAKKKIILPQNGQPDQLHQCMKMADGFIGTCDVPEIESYDWSVTIGENIDDESDELDLDLTTQLTLYTSGSSGTAKAIKKSFLQLITEVEQLESTFGQRLNKDGLNCIVMATVSHQHIYGLLFKLIWPLWTGRDIYLRSFEYPEHLVHQIKQYPDRKICLISSPAYYHRLVKDNVLVAIQSQLVQLFSSGGPLSAEAAMLLHSSLSQAPIEVLGSTETGGIAWRQRECMNDDSWQFFSGIDYAIDPNSQKLRILSPYVDPNNWILTDDRGELIGKHKFKLLGRADRIVKIEEKRCSLDEIQYRLNSHPWIAQAYVLLLTDNRTYLGAVIELSELGLTEFETTVKFKFDRKIKTYLKNFFEPLVVPRKYRYMAQLPFNSQGKLNKTQLEREFD